MSAPISTSAPCYASVQAINAAYPTIAASALSSADKNAMILTAQSMIDSIVGPQLQFAPRDEGQHTVFPRLQDSIVVRHSGSWDPTTGVYPCPATMGNAYAITAPGSIGTNVYLAGQHLIALRAVGACPAEAVNFVAVDVLPDSKCLGLVPWGVARATILLVGALFDAQQTTAVGSGVSTSAISAGDTIRLGDFSYTAGSSSASSSSSVASPAAAQFIPESVSTQVKALLNPYIIRNFSIQ